MKKLVALLTMVIALVVAFAGMAQAEDQFPTKPLQLVVPFKPGGGSDVSARVFSKYASRYLPEKIIVQNIAGARGRTAELDVKRSDPDGYKLLWQHQNLHMAYATGRSDYQYDVFDPVAACVGSSVAIIVGKDSPYKNIKELVDAAKAQPGTISWGAAINGFSHFALLTLLDASSLDESSFHIIGMSGDKNRVVAIMQGNLEATAVAVSAVRPYIDSGDVKILGIMDEQRHKSYPKIPTLKEQGVDAIFEFIYATYAPKGTPADVIKVINDAYMKAADDPECQKELYDGWMTPMKLDTAKLNEKLAKDSKYFYDLAQKFHLAKE